jgi:hypothetical protein
MSDTAVYPSAWFGVVFSLGQLGDVERGVTQGDQFAPVRQRDWIGKGSIPRQDLTSV